MTVPKRRLSKMKGRKRRTHYVASHAPSPAICPGCGQEIRPHTLCAACGTYRGRVIIAPKKEEEKEKGKE
ncbi:MAG: 50S ribosomal protein L32 [Deltaproteobacteria bacterium]|nr:50S ribosomal protein L32 [Deltaproteobacteria bacterium]